MDFRAQSSNKVEVRHEVIEMIERLLNNWVLASLFIIGLGLYTASVVIREHVAIKKLGGRAAVVKGKLPFGMTSLL